MKLKRRDIKQLATEEIKEEINFLEEWENEILWDTTYWQVSPWLSADIKKKKSIEDLIMLLKALKEQNKLKVMRWKIRAEVSKIETKYFRRFFLLDKS